MPEASPLPADQFESVLARLPPDLDLEAIARETEALIRRRGIRSARDLLRLLLSWAVGGHSLQYVAGWAGEFGIANLTDEALTQRFHNAAGFVESLTGMLLQRSGRGAAASPCWHGRVLRISDSTSLSMRASEGTDYRVHGVYDLGQGCFTHLELTDKHGGEALDRGGPVAGEIRVADRGYANALAWQRFLESSQGRGDFIVRMRWNTVRLVDADGKPFDLPAWLAARPREENVHEIGVLAQSGKHQAPIPIRLIARRKSPEDTARTVRQLHRNASRKQTRLDPRSLIAAEYVVLATSLEAGAVPASEVLAAYRLRWQIEMAFKRLKSLLNIDAIPTRTDAGTRCWLYAHLLVAVLGGDLTQDILESFPSGLSR